MRIGGAVRVERADGDDERVVAGRGLHRHRRARAVVPHRGDDDDTVEPEALDGRVERVVHEARGPAAAHREVGDANVVEILVGEDPVDRVDHVARPRRAARVGRAHADDRCVLRDARVERRRSGRDSRDHRPVALVVARRVRGERGHVDARDDARAKVVELRGIDAAVDDRDRRRLRCGRRRRAPEGRHLGRLRPEAGLLDTRRGDLLVADDREYVVVGGELQQVLASDRAGHAADRVERLLDLPERAVLRELARDARARFAGAAANDDVEVLVGVRLGLCEQRLRNEGCGALGDEGGLPGERGACQGTEERGGSDQDGDAAHDVGTLNVAPTVFSTAAGSPEGARARPAGYPLVRSPHLSLQSLPQFRWEPPHR